MTVGLEFVSKIPIQLEFFEFLKQVGSIFQSKITNVFKCIQWTQDWIIIKLLDYYYYYYYYYYESFCDEVYLL